MWFLEAETENPLPESGCRTGVVFKAKTWRICKDIRQFENVNAVFEYGQGKKKEKNLRMSAQLISNSHWRRLGSLFVFSGSNFWHRYVNRKIVLVKHPKSESAHNSSFNNLFYCVVVNFVGFFGEGFKCFEYETQNSITKLAFHSKKWWRSNS